MRVCVISVSSTNDLGQENMKSEEVEVLEQKLQALKEDFQSFAYAVSHDVAAPLRHIDGFTRRTLKRSADSLDEESLQDLGIVLKSVGKCQKDLDAIRKYSRLSSNFRPRENIDINAIVESVIHDCADKIASVEAIVECLPLQPCCVDPSQIKELFLQLIDNALCYHSKEESPKIVISAHTEGDVQHISVSDNGIGIAQQNHAKVFVIFRRAVTPQQYEGQGCGLAFVKRIITLHEGDISLVSEEGKGTTVHFSLPLNSA